MKRSVLLIFIIVPTVIFAQSVTINGINYNLITKGYIAEVAENSLNKSNTITIPSEVTYNGENYTVEKINENAFISSSMTSVEIANSVKSIGWQAFCNCSKLEKVKIGSGVSFMGGDVLSDCSNLSYIDISKDNKFYDSRNNCNAVIETETNTLWYASNNTIIPNTVLVIQSGAFEGLKNITSLNIPSSVQTIGRWGVAYCEQLKEVTIGDGMESIGQQAFESDNNLKVVYIGKGIKKIDWGAFGKCPNIEDIYINAETPPSATNGAFVDSHIEYTTLHVPSSAIENYKNIEPWKNFKEIVSIAGNDDDKKKCDKPIINYFEGNLALTSGTDGVEFVTNIENADIRKFYEPIIPLTVTYNISVYATKSGYENSDVATATLCWIDVEPKTEGIADGIAQMAARYVMVKAEGGLLIVEGADDNTHISVYTIDGVQVGTTTSSNGVASISTSIPKSSVAIVKIGNKSVKVMMK